SRLHRIEHHLTLARQGHRRRFIVLPDHSWNYNNSKLPVNLTKGIPVRFSLLFALRAQAGRDARASFSPLESIRAIGLVLRRLNEITKMILKGGIRFHA